MQSNPVILLVDDHEEIIKFLRLAVGEEYTVLIAADGRQAMEMLREKPARLVITGKRPPGDSFLKRMPIGVTRAGARFVEQLTDFVLSHIEDEELNADHLAGTMHMSRMTLYRKLKSFTGLSPHEFINDTRLRKAATMLSSGEYKIFEVVVSVGYKSTAHFGKLFNKQFGMSPTQFIQCKAKSKNVFI